MVDSFDLFDFEAKKKETTEPVDHLPPWLDRKRLAGIRELLNRHFFSIFFAHLSGLVLLVFVRSVFVTLHKSGKSSDLVSIFYRYWHTVAHVRQWYEGDLFDPNHSAYKSLQTVGIIPPPTVSNFLYSR